MKDADGVLLFTAAVTFPTSTQSISHPIRLSVFLLHPPLLSDPVLPLQNPKSQQDDVNLGGTEGVAKASPETRPPPWVNKSSYLISLVSFEVKE